MDSLPPQSSFGEVLAQFRKQKKLSQMELADRSGLSRNGIADLERGARTRPRRETLALLAEALGLTPVQKTTLTEAARGSREEPHGTRGPALPAPPVLLGRAAEKVVIHELITGDALSLVSFEGPPGMGKSSLLFRTGHDALEAGWSVHYGRCHRWSTHELFSPLTYLLESETLRDGGSRQADFPVLAKFFSGAAPTADEQRWSTGQIDRERFLLREEFARWFESLSGPLGTLLLLDDLQWAGDEAVQVLSSLMDYPWKIRFRVMIAFRSTDVVPSGTLLSFLAQREREGGLRRVELSPLDETESRELWKSGLTTAAPAGAVPPGTLAMAQGNPYFILQFARYSQGGVPRPVSDLVLQQYEQLPSTAQKVLGFLAVADLPLASVTLEAAAREARGLDSVAPALEELLRRRLAVETGGSYSCAHDLIRELVLDRMGQHAGIEGHRAIGTALEQTFGQSRPEVLAWHFHRAQSIEKAVSYYRDAGLKAEKFFSFTEAQGYYRNALECLPASGPEWASRVELNTSLARVLMAELRDEEALPVLARALEEMRTEGDIAGQIAIVEAQLSAETRLGRVEEGLERGNRLLPVVRSLPPSAASAEFLASLAYLLHMNKDFAAQGSVIREAEAMLPHLTDRHAQLKVWQGLALFLTAESRYEEASVLAGEQILPFLEAIGDKHQHMTAALNLSSTLLMLGQYDKVRGHLSRSRQAAAAMNARRALGFAHLLSVNVEYESGRWDDAEQFGRVGTGQGSPSGRMKGDFSPEVSLEAGRIRRLRGDARGARILFQAAEDQVLMGTYPLLEATLEAEIALLEGRFHQALPALAPLTEPPWSTYPGMSDWDAMLGCATALSGRPQEGGEKTAQAERTARADGTVPTLSDTLRYGGWIALDAGRVAEAIGRLEEGLQLESRLRRPYNRAKFLGLLALAREEAGDQAEGLWDEARQLCADLGERVWLARIERHRGRRGYGAFFSS